MALDLTLTGAAFAAATFANGLSAGYGRAAGVANAGGTFTIECRAKCSAPNSTAAIIGSYGFAAICHTPEGKIYAIYGLAEGSRQIDTNFYLNDGAPHHLELVVGPNMGGANIGAMLFIDGAPVGSNSNGSLYDPQLANFTVGGYSNNGNVFTAPFNGVTDEVAVWNVVRHTAAFTPPTAPYTGNETGLVALYHLDGNGTNSQGTPAVDTTAPAFSSARVDSGSPAVILVTMNEALAASVPPNSAFTASGGRTVTGVAINGAVASVTVNTAYAAGDTITIAYAQPGANPRLQDAAGNLTASFAAQPVTNNIATAVAFTDKVRFSPYNWKVTPTSAKSINPGSYFNTLFTGTSCTLNFDLTGEMASPFTMAYRIDLCGPWRYITVSTPTVALDMSGSDAAFATDGHFLEVVFRANNNNGITQRWNPQTAAMVLTGIALDSGAVLKLPPNAKSKRILFYGDSITEGMETHLPIHDATGAWTFIAGSALGAEFGIVGFASQGWASAYNPPAYTPFFPSTWNYIYEGVARDFSNAPDLIVINHGTNDSSNITSVATTTLNAMLAATPSTTKIVVMQPLNGSHASELQAAVAAVGNARCTYLSTAGWYPSGPLHPTAASSATVIAPLAINALSAVLNGAAIPPTLTQRTATISFNRGPSTAPVVAANLTGAKVAFYDEPTPDLYGVARYQTAAETMDANGVMVATYGSALPAGGTAGYVVQFADGQHYNGQVVLS